MYHVSAETLRHIVPKPSPRWLLLALLLIGPPQTRADWQAGVARTRITPSEPMWMSGYAGRNKPAEGTLHELWAKALALTAEDNTTIVLVSLDLVGVSREVAERIHEQLEADYGLTRRQVCLATSHTHTGPVIAGNLDTMYAIDADQRARIRAYATFLEEAVVGVVGKALNSRMAATVSAGIGSADFAVNRRNNREPDVPQLRTAGELRGPVDHDVPVLTVTADDRLTAIVFGYACHATVLNFYQWSGDWPGFGQIELEKRYPGATALFFAGCGADQNPLPRRTVALAERYGRAIADAVQRTIDEELEPVTPQLQTARQELPLPFAAPMAREELVEHAAFGDKYQAGRARALLQRLDKSGVVVETAPYPITLWRVGRDVQWVHLGGEVVVDYSLRLKAELGPGPVFVGAYMNDVMAYIPSERVLREGGYEGKTSMVYYGQPSAWSPGLEDAITSAVGRLARRTLVNGPSE